MLFPAKWLPLALVPLALAALPAHATDRDHAGKIRYKAGETAVAAQLTRLEWQKAKNRKACAPLVFTDTAGAAINARPAEFSDGWAIAFDLPRMRSAYGVAGVGLLDTDRASAEEKERQIKAQWPYFRELPGLPQPAYAGYGLEGAEPYPADTPNGERLDSLAYVRVGGQKCLYNVWSKLGRDHLEALLDSLRMLPEKR